MLPNLKENYAQIQTILKKAASPLNPNTSNRKAKKHRHTNINRYKHLPQATGS